MIIHHLLHARHIYILMMSTNDALTKYILIILSASEIVKKTFYFGLYDVRHMDKDHRDIETGKQLPSFHELPFQISSRVYFVCTILDKIAIHQLWTTGWNKK